MKCIPFEGKGLFLQLSSVDLLNFNSAPPGNLIKGSYLRVASSARQLNGHKIATRNAKHK